MSPKLSRSSLVFAVRGNHQDPEGDPLGYTTRTYRGKWNARSQRYEDWKSYVWSQFCSWCPETPPIDPKRHIFVSTVICFTGRRHAEPTNVTKGLVDSLSDKRHTIASRKPGVPSKVVIEPRLWSTDKNVCERTIDFREGMPYGIIWAFIRWNEAVS